MNDIPSLSSALEEEEKEEKEEKEEEEEKGFCLFDFS